MPHSHASLATASRDRGFSLIVSLMMLIVIVILGVSGAQIAINEERGARNDRDRQIAFQAAEAAIRDAEWEIYGPVSAASPMCTLAGQQNRGKMRYGTQTCFNETNYFGYAGGCSSGTSAGLCIYDALSPAYLAVDFAGDANGSNPTTKTVAFGTYTGRTFPSQTQSGLNGKPVSRYPPRYIIEAVPKNTSTDSRTDAGAGAGLGGSIMFRVTAMGFGANSNSQVVLQAVVATQD